MRLRTGFQTLLLICLPCLSLVAHADMPLLTPTQQAKLKAMLHGQNPTAPPNKTQGPVAPAQTPTITFIPAHKTYDTIPRKTIPSTQSPLFFVPPTKP